MHQVNRTRLKQLAILPLIVVVSLLAYSFTPSGRIYTKIVLRELALENAKSAVSTAAITIYNPAPVLSFLEAKKPLFDSLGLEAMGLSRKAFDMALKGMEKLKKADRIHSNILSIIDFTQSSTSKRLFVFDLDNGRLLFNTLVAHGKKTGEEWARSFSNSPRSNKSSIGFYVTGQTYNGSNGYSLKLMGMESGFNSNAYQRAIVVHGADYVNEEYIENQGYIGRSQGCPALMPEVCRPIINTIKEGSCLFVYYPLPQYLKRSSLVK